MNKSLKGFVAGFIASSLLAASVSYASGGAVKQIFYDVGVAVNGKVLQLADDMRPFTMDGRTFLPVRALSEALGKEVGWDEATRTVQISDKAGAADSTQDGPTAKPPAGSADDKAKSAKLSSLEYFNINGVYWKSGEAQANTGDFMQDSIYCSNAVFFSEPYTQDYLIDGKYSKFQGTVFVGDKSFYPTLVFQVWGDGKLIYTSDEIAAGFLPKKFDVDVKGVDVLKIGFSKTNSSLSNITFGISGATLYK